MASMRNDGKQNVTISLSRRLLKKAKILAAQRDTSISGLLAREIESPLEKKRRTNAPRARLWHFLTKAFRMGGVIRAGRDDLHEQ